jgi:hypothetical protein
MIDTNTQLLIKKMIKIIDTIPMSNREETVASKDEELAHKDEFQWDIFLQPPEGKPKDRFTYDFVLDEYVREIVFNCTNIDLLREPGLNWAFIRKYEKTGRDKLEPHFDSDEYTINIMLSEPSEYKGGEFIYCPSKYYNECKDTDMDGKKKIIDKLLSEGNAYKLKPRIGETVVLAGDYQNNIEPNLHCVLPVREGKRYVLCLFFDKTCKSLANKIINLYNEKKLN